MQLTRRELAAVATGAALTAPSFCGFSGARAQSPTLPHAPTFGYADVAARARDLASAPFDATTPAPPDGLAKLFDSSGPVRFRPESSFLADSGSPFRVQLFHLSSRFRQPTTINIVRDGLATPIPYTMNLFDYGSAKPSAPLPINTGFAGFRVLFPLNDSRVFDETLAFLGASYFRLLGRGQRYGLSARGIAVDAGLPHEEFPFFREFWIETPAADADFLRIYALLDGPSITGAYQFELRPNQDSRLDVSAALFMRQGGRRIGLAPLTSMFCAGENDRRAGPDYRPERHDSDGLALHTGADEWIWRPLRNPPAEAISSFLDKDIRGFGLFQRDRDFNHYQDIDDAYELRPSYWITPKSPWGAGRVELVELPTPDDQNDNIVASWVGDAPFLAGERNDVAYTMVAIGGPRDPSPNGRVVDTFETHPQADGAASPPSNTRRFLVDFAGGDLAYHLGDPSTVSVVPTVLGGDVIRSFLTPNARAGGFRAGVDVAAPSGKSCEIRLFLRADGRALTETWTLPWTAP